MMVHGGAWNKIPDDTIEAHAKGCQFAVERGYEVLKNGGEALDAVETAICILEDDTTFDAGHGSFPTRDGEVELDATLMDGLDLNIGAIACVIGIPNPIRLARLVLNSPQILLAGNGARKFAEHHNLQTCTSDDLIIPGDKWRNFKIRNEPQGPCDTVGAVALEDNGNIATGLSTGGQPNRVPGRVGDVPQAGCGFYADNLVGGVACSGWGEAIVRVGLAHRTLQLLETNQNPQEAADGAIAFMQKRVGGFGGILVLDPTGQVGIAHNTRYFAHAYMVDGMSMPSVEVKHPEITS